LDEARDREAGFVTGDGAAEEEEEAGFGHRKGGAG
jgi:hypothetical protein